MNKLVIILCLFSIFSNTLIADEASVRDAFKRSYQYEQSQNYKDAIRALYPIYKNNKKLYSINLRMAWLFYLSGHYANSIKHYEKSIILAPSAIEPMLGMLLPLLAQQNYQKSELIAHKILRIDSNNYLANLRLIIALRLQNKSDLAQSTVQKMRTLYPGDIVFIEQEGLLSEKNKNFDKATELYGELLNLDPENLTAKRYFGI